MQISSLDYLLDGHVQVQTGHSNRKGSSIKPGGVEDQCGRPLVLIVEVTRHSLDGHYSKDVVRLLRWKYYGTASVGLQKNTCHQRY